jgi:hypothetical protein
MFIYIYTGSNIIKLKKKKPTIYMTNFNPDLRLHSLTQGACGFQADCLQVVPLGLATGVHHNIVIAILDICEI